MRFGASVLDSFRFLDQRGYRPISVGEDRVRFRSANVEVDVSWDRRSGELEVYFMQRAGYANGTRLSLTSIAGAEARDSEGVHLPLQVASEERVGSVVATLAALMHRYGARALDGDPFYLRKLQDDVRRTALLETRELQARRIREAARGAWQRRAYIEVIELLTQIESDLSPSERAKLRIARQRGASASEWSR